MCGRMCVLFVCLVGACLFHCVLRMSCCPCPGAEPKKNRSILSEVTIYGDTFRTLRSSWDTDRLLPPSPDSLKWTGAATGHILPARRDPPRMAALQKTGTSLCRQSGGHLLGVRWIKAKRKPPNKSFLLGSRTTRCRLFP